MARTRVVDRWGNEIYLTEERWHHILETHDEMRDYRDALVQTLRAGERRQDAFDMSKYKYSLPFADLPEAFTHIVVVVKCTHRVTGRGEDVPNNFVLTAYQVARS